MNWYLHVLKNYANFNGRARRKEFWMFSLFNMLVSIVLATIENFLIGTFSPETGYGMISGIYSIAMMIPSLAVSARRLHDTDRSGWWQLLLVLPVIGALVLFVFYCFDSQPGENRFGPNPKENEQPVIKP